MTHFVTESNHGKTTDPNRFNDLDLMIVKNLKAFNLPKIHDIAVSSGITSCELKILLNETGIGSEFFISDRFMLYYYRGKRIVRIYDNKKKLLYGHIFGVLADKKLSNYFIFSKLLFHFLKRFASKKQFKKILMLDTDTTELINKGELKVIYYDAFETEIINDFDFVRCMNLLNVNSWFSEDQIIKALLNIKNSLKEGGIFLIGRTNQESNINNAAFFIKENNKFLHVEDLNCGCELKRIILDL
jgi:SAM-dependent methyltransferase